MADKPRGRPPVPQHKSADAGHLGHDDRGNVTWEWEDDPDLLADDSFGGAERLRALVDPQLELKDDDDPRTVRSNPKGLKAGYDPYDSGALGKQRWKKKKDLRELSKWIQLRKKTGARRDDD